MSGSKEPRRSMAGAALAPPSLAQIGPLAAVSAATRRELVGSPTAAALAQAALAQQPLAERVIQGADCLSEGTDWLAAQDPQLARAVQLCGPLPLRLRPDGFDALLDAIISQQVSVASAQAIRRRLETAGFTDPAIIQGSDLEALRAAGLSRQKAGYVLALAAAELDYAALRHAPSAQVISTLVALPGIGRWTAEIYAMFALGRADVFAPGDLALQEAARRLFGWAERPNEKQLRQLAEAWSPWRSVAARLLWAYYRLDKGTEGIMS